MNEDYLKTSEHYRLLSDDYISQANPLEPNLHITEDYPVSYDDEFVAYDD